MSAIGLMGAVFIALAVLGLYQVMLWLAFRWLGSKED